MIYEDWFWDLMAWELSTDPYEIDEEFKEYEELEKEEKQELYVKENGMLGFYLD